MAIRPSKPQGQLATSPSVDMSKDGSARLSGPKSLYWMIVTILGLNSKKINLYT
jgi:hypothetical protein